MTLDDLPDGASRRVARVSGEPSMRERLTELGFTPGVAVRVVRRAPLGDPLQVAVRDGLFALRRHEARAIELTAEAADGATA